MQSGEYYLHMARMITLHELNQDERDRSLNELVPSELVVILSYVYLKRGRIYPSNLITGYSLNNKG